MHEIVFDAIENCQSSFDTLVRIIAKGGIADEKQRIDRKDY